MVPAVSVKTVIVGVVLVLFWGAILARLRWRLVQERNAEAARGIVKTRRQRVLDRIGLVFTALVVSGVGIYVEEYGEGWSSLVLVLVCVAFIGWKLLQRRPIDPTS
jgi:RNase P/RNase MRP subunit POP5